MNTIMISTPSVAGPNITATTIFSKLFALLGIGAGFIYMAFSILFFFRIKTLHNGLKTESGKLIVLLALANVVISIVISVLGFLLAVV